MEISSLAGKPAPGNMLVDLALLEGEYYVRRPDVGDPNQLVSFGTSGHRGSSLRGTFNEAHILAITQAICDYRRIDAPATPEQKESLAKLSPEAVKESKLAGETITAKLTRAPGNNAPIGGLKVVAGSGWFAARPSGTENIYKIYAESFKDQAHLDAILSEAREIVNNALNSTSPRGRQAEGQT